MGQHWLDVVRFAENRWLRVRHRTAMTPGAIATTWSARSTNDKPYDRFITEQLAGDEIAPKEDETLIASGSTPGTAA